MALYLGTPATGTLIGALPLPALDAADSAVLTQAWDRDGLAGPTLISAQADVSGIVAEFDEANNASQALLTLPGACQEDVVGDGEITALDIQAVAQGWNGFDPNLDMDGNGNVDIRDILLVAARWGRGCW